MHVFHVPDRLLPTVVLGILALALLPPGTASGACIASDVKNWTVSDPLDQAGTGFTDVTLVFFELGRECELYMQPYAQSGFDPNLSAVSYLFDVNGDSSWDREILLPMSGYRHSGDPMLGISGADGMSYSTAPDIRSSGDAGVFAQLDALGVTTPDVGLKVRVSMREAQGVNGDFVPDAAGSYTLNLPFTAGTLTKPVPVDGPALHGTGQVGQRLSCEKRDWLMIPTSFAFQWLRDGVPFGDPVVLIPHVAGWGDTYVVQEEDAGHTISCQVSATNKLGTTAATTEGISIPAPPAAPVLAPPSLDQPAPPAVQDVAAPVIRQLTISPQRFDAAHSGLGVRAAAARGARVSYLLSEPADITVRIQQQAERTKRWAMLARSVPLDGRPGPNTFRLTGRWSGRSLKAGVYRLVLTARDTASNTSLPGMRAFRILG